MAIFKSRESNRRKSRSNQHHRHTRALGLEGLEHRQMLAAISGLDSAPIVEQQPAYAEQAEIAVQMDRENSIECLQVPIPGQPTQPFFRPNPSGLSSSPTGSLGFDVESQGTNDAVFAKYDGYVPYDVQGQGSVKDADETDVDPGPQDVMAESTEPFFRPNPSGLSASPTGSLGLDLEGQTTNDAVFAKYDTYVPYDVEGQGANGISVVKRVDKVAEDTWKVEELAGETTEPFYRPNPVGDEFAAQQDQATDSFFDITYQLEDEETNSITKRIDKVTQDTWKVEELAGESTEPSFRPNPSGLSSSSTGSLGFDVEGQGTNDAAFAKYDGYIPYDSPGDDVAANAPPTEE